VGLISRKEYLTQIQGGEWGVWIFRH
jgi:hypothetical protein